MSGLYMIDGKSAKLEHFRLSTTAATVIVDATNAAKSVVWLHIHEHSGATPTLTIDLYDGTNPYYLRNALAMTAKERVLIEMGIPVPYGWTLRVTAGTADTIHVLAAVLLGSSTA